MGLGTWDEDESSEKIVDFFSSSSRFVGNILQPTTASRPSITTHLLFFVAFLKKANLCTARCSSSIIFAIPIPLCLSDKWAPQLGLDLKKCGWLVVSFFYLTGVVMVDLTTGQSDSENHLFANNSHAHQPFKHLLMIIPLLNANQHCNTSPCRSRLRSPSSQPTMRTTTTTTLITSLFICTIVLYRSMMMVKLVSIIEIFPIVRLIFC